MVNTKDNDEQYFEYAVIVALKDGEIKDHPERNSFLEYREDQWN